MTDDNFDVVVVGNVGIDTNIYLQTDEIDFNVEANFTENMDYVGQAGGYVSRGFAQLGYRTAFIGSVGDDHNAQFVRQEFVGDGIDTTAMFIDPSGTARSVNIMYRDGRRKNFYDGKNHMHLQPDLDACQEVLSRSRFVHFSIPNWARYLLPVARELGLTISCDIQDIVDRDDPYRLDFVTYSDILFFSAVNYPDPTPLIEFFLSAKADQIIVVGMGSLGCALATKDGIEFFPPVEMDPPVIDTNGAGDGLAVGFLSSYVLDGCSLVESILRGQIAARYSCTQKATSSSLITKDKLESFYTNLYPDPESV